MREDVSPSILAVGASLANLRRTLREENAGRNLARHAASERATDRRGEPQVSQVDTAERAVELLKVLKFDLVAIGDDVSDATPWQLAKQVRTVWPWQRWAFVAHEMDHEDEVMARSLGAVAIFEGPEAWGEMVDVAARIRRKNPAAVVAGLTSGLSEYSPV